MFEIIEAKWLADKVRLIVVNAPRIASKHRPGHFVIVRVRDGGERIPLTVAKAAPSNGTVTLVVQSVGLTTEILCSLSKGDNILDMAGPLGRPTDIENFGHVVLVGGGVGTAVILPQASALKQAGNKVSAIIGGRSKPYVILEDELLSCCDKVFPCTDDGSYGYHGFVTGKLAEVIESSNPKVGAVITAGPVPMMKAIAGVTAPHKIKTIASLNPIMVDGTGMCGGCRVTVGGKQKFACVDGPEFDAHEVDFKELSDRLTAYKDIERIAHEKFLEHSDHKCKLDNVLQK